MNELDGAGPFISQAKSLGKTANQLFWQTSAAFLQSSSCTVVLDYYLIGTCFSPNLVCRHNVY